ncbi:MAG: ATP-binding cassette domain-containing protein [Acidobacteria bacterium]|nr:ATP-binding cassette domain-containing protein [Acidobacteriota bacterium]
MTRLGRLLEAERQDMWVVVAYSLAIGILTLVVPVVTQSVVNTIAFGTVLQPLVLLALIVFLALAFSAALRGLRHWVVEVLQRRIFVRVISDAVMRLLRVRVEAFDAGHGPELVNRFFEVVTVQKGAAILLIDGLAILIQTVAGLMLLAVYHPLLLAFGAVLFAAIFVIVVPLGFGAISTAVTESKAKYEMAAWLEEIARHSATFKSPHGAALATAQANSFTSKYLTERAKHFKILFRQIISSLVLEAVASAVLLGAGGWLVMQRQLTLGQLVAAELIVAVVVGGFAKFGKQLETFYDLLAAMDKLGYLTDLPLEHAGGEPHSATGPAALRLHNVAFSFNGHRNVFEGVNAEIAPASRVVLYSGLGQGKSTLIDLLYGLRIPSEGTIELDGHDYRDLSVAALRQQTALVRNAEIFHGTLADNVRLGNNSITTGEIREALTRVGLGEALMALPDGLQTVLNTGGLPLSQGQLRLLMFGRAISQKPRLLLIDEAIDAIDDTAERDRLLDTLFAPDAPWTVVMATRNAALAGRCAQTLPLRRTILEENKA